MFILYCCFFCFLTLSYVFLCVVMFYYVFGILVFSLFSYFEIHENIIYVSMLHLFLICAQKQPPFRGVRGALLSTTEAPKERWRPSSSRRLHIIAPLFPSEQSHLSVFFFQQIGSKDSGGTQTKNQRRARCCTNRKKDSSRCWIISRERDA